MRLRRLNLLRYGHFTDFILDFGEHPATGLDFHIIFGENEAGKSTAFNAYLDLLFGIEKNSKYNFLHAYSNLHVGAVLEINNNNIEVARIKKDRGSLIGANGHPVDEEMLVSALHGLSRESYQKMFSLNDETIERGGEEILASKGDFGRLLFAGSAGLTDLSEELETLRERANKVYAGRSRSYEIASLRKELQQIKDELKNLDTQSSTYDRLSKKNHTIEKACQDTRSKKKDLTGEKANLKVIKDAFAIWNKLTKLEDELAQIDHLPDVPENWIKEIRDLQQGMTIEITSKSNAQSNIDSSQDELENLKADPIIIGLKENVKAIVHLKTRAQAAREHLPQVRDNLLETDSELEEIRKRLGVGKDAELAQFIISDDTIANLDELLQKEAQLVNHLNIAKQEASDAKDALLQAQEEAIKSTPPDEKMSILIALHDEYAENDPQPRLDQTQEALDQICRELELALKNLAPWTGTKDDIKAQEVPTLSQVNRWSKKIDGLKNNLEIKKTLRSQEEQTLAVLECNVKTLSTQLGVLTDSYAKTSREARDNAWTIHRKNLNDETAVAFERTLANDDRIRDDRLVANERLALLRIEEGNLATKSEVFKGINAEIKRIETELQEIQNEMAPALEKAGLPRNFQVEDLLKWVDNFQDVREIIEKENECLVKRNQAKDAYDRQREGLLGALAGVGQRPSEVLRLKELRAIAKHYREGATQSKTQYTIAKKAVSQAEEHTRKRNKNHEIATEEFEKWEGNWKCALRGLWLEKKNVSQVRALLEQLRRLTPLVAYKEKLLKEIHGKEKDISEFHNEVCDLLCLLGEERQRDLVTQFSLLQERLEAAQQIDTKRTNTRKNQERFENQLDNANSKISHMETRIKEMAALFTTCEDSSTLDELAPLVDQSKRKRELKNVVSEKEAILIQCLAVKTRNDAEEVLKAKNLSDVEARLSMIDGDLEEVEQELEKLIGERQDALREIDAIGGDASVAHLNEKRECILLEISHKANRALALHLGLMAADSALVAYRNRHRSDLLKQTADAFKCITSDEFMHLTTHLDRSEEKLVAERAQGGSISVGAMSKGTRFQLYLALRLAGYRRFCSLNGSLPFIGDDIMETFDDGRAESAIRQLSEIAKSGQVLYFTHHLHLCKIAKKVCGNGVVIHEIPKCRKP